MTLLGLSPTWFFGLLAASVAVVAILYRLKLRRRTIEVGFARLWRRVVKHRPATSLMERFRQLLSFLLQVAFAFLVLLAIARPRLSSDAESAGRFVIVIDASGRMQARMAVGSDRTRFDEAIDRAKMFVGRLGEGDRACIVLAGAVPDPVSVFETDREVLLDALDAASPGKAPSDLDASVRFARDLAGDDGRIIVFTDAPFHPLPLRGRVGRGGMDEGQGAKAKGQGSDGVEWVQIGKPLDNLGITRFAASPRFDSPGEVELFYEVRNFGRAAADVTLRINRLRTGDASSAVPAASLIESVPLKLVPGAKTTGVLRTLAREDARLIATLTDREGNVVRDGLSLDDRAEVTVKAPRVKRVLVAGPANVFLDKLLSSDPLLAWRRIPAEEFRGDVDADVVIFDRCAPKEGFPRAIYIRPDGAGSPVEVAGEVEDVFVDAVAADHPVMRYVGDLSDLNVMRSQALVARRGDVTLASCAGTPVMIARRSDDSRQVVLGFGLTDSDLVLRVAFPKIFGNAISWVASGESTSADERNEAIASIDERVSDLHAVPTAEASIPAAAPVRVAATGDLWPWIAACALTLTVFEWISFHRRWTV